MSDPLICSFCDKNQFEVHHLIAGNSAFICNERVAVSREILARFPTKEEVAATIGWEGELP